MKKHPIELQPWNLSYQMADVRPSWSQHGMPALFETFISLVQNSKNQHGVHLDIGCGNGIKTVNFALAGLPTLGIDISEDGFNEARKRIEDSGLTVNCTVMQSSCLSLPLEDKMARSASDVLCFTHLRPKDYGRYKSELYRVLKGGRYVLMVLFSDKDEHFHGHKVSREYSFKFDPENPLMAGYSHYHGMVNVHFDRAEIERTFKDMFEIIEMKEVKHPVYPYRYLWNVILKKPETNGKGTFN